MFYWAKLKFRAAKGGLKIQPYCNNTMMIPDVVHITPAKLHDKYGLEEPVFAKVTIIMKDGAYFDFNLMLRQLKTENMFVTRIKINTVFHNIKELALTIDIEQDMQKMKL